MKYKFYCEGQDSIYRRNAVFRTDGSTYRRLGRTQFSFPEFNNFTRWEEDFVRVPDTLATLMGLAL